MVKSLLIAVNEKLTCDDLGKLLLRLAVGGLMLFHGLHVIWRCGLYQRPAGGKRAAGVYCLRRIDWRSGGTDPDHCRPLYAPAALVLAFTMIVAWLMVGTGKTFALDAVGAWAIESLYFFIGSLAVAF